jgi:hypothetical protein
VAVAGRGGVAAVDLIFAQRPRLFEDHAPPTAAERRRQLVLLAVNDDGERSPVGLDADEYRERAWSRLASSLFGLGLGADLDELDP